MRKIAYMLAEMLHLIRRRKLYFLAPILILLALLAFLVFQLGPGALLTFIYAGF
jgi:hypothetical protein